MGLRVVVPPTAEPITLAMARAHLAVVPYIDDGYGNLSHPDDVLIAAMLSAAREWAENFTGRSFVIKTYELALDAFPENELELPMPPVIDVVSVSYVNDALDTVTIASIDYMLDQYQVCAGWINPAVGYTWPEAAEMINAVKVRYRAGYQVAEPASDAPSADSLPFAAQAAILLMLGHLYANRETVVVGTIAAEIPQGAEALLRPLRVRTGMA